MASTFKINNQAVWLSDHEPTEEQRNYLESRGYTITQIKSPWYGRWKSARSIYNAMMMHCTPSIIIMVLPSATLGGEFVELCKDIPVYRALMDRVGEEWIWTGKWSRIYGTRYRMVEEEIPAAFEKEIIV
jgi:hypothetical protein